MSDGFREYEAALEIAREPEVPELSEVEVARIEHAVFMPHSPGPADALFLFGTVQADWDGLAVAVQRGDYARVILAGRLGPTYFRDGQPIARAMEGELVRRGVNPQLLTLQETSSNTLEDVTHSLELLNGAQSVVFAAKWHHSGRCQRTMRKWLPEVSLSAHVIAACYGEVCVRPGTWSGDPTARARVYGEWMRIQKYAVAGDIAWDP